LEKSQIGDLPFLFSKGHGILLKHPVDVGVITLEDVKIETGTAKEILDGVAGKAVILSVMLIGKRRPRCHDEMPKRFVLFLSNHPGHGSHSYLVVDLYGFIDKPSAA
jgi:hypothetical protein